MGVAQKLRARATQVLDFGSIYQGAILVNAFELQPYLGGKFNIFWAGIIIPDVRSQTPLRGHFDLPRTIHHGERQPSINKPSRLIGAVSRSVASWVPNSANPNSPGCFGLPRNRARPFCWESRTPIGIDDLRDAQSHTDCHEDANESTVDLKFAETNNMA